MELPGESGLFTVGILALYRRSPVVTTVFSGTKRPRGSSRATLHPHPYILLNRVRGKYGDDGDDGDDGVVVNFNGHISVVYPL
jgi:hypothetical protein